MQLVRVQGPLLGGCVVSGQEWRAERDREVIKAWNRGDSQQAIISRFKLTAIGIAKIVDGAREAGIEITPRINRKICEDVGRYIAAERGVSFDDLLFGQSDEAAGARAAAWAHILRQTGATHRDLARVWGEPHTKITEAVRNGRLPEVAR